MSTTRNLLVLASLGVVGLLGLSSCSAGPGSRAPASTDTPPGHALGSVMPAPPAGEVIGTGTVMDVAGDVELCLGPVAESYPPQCSGIPLEGWTWDGVDGSERSGEIRWGAYAVTGTFDGTALALTEPPAMLALYDPMPVEDPSGGGTGETTEARLLAIQEQLPDRLGADGTVLLSSYPDRGYLWVDVVWDDGTLQRGADEDFGPDTVLIRSALRPVGG